MKMNVDDDHSNMARNKSLTVDELIEQILRNQFNASSEKIDPSIGETVETMANETGSKNYLNVMNYYPPDYMSNYVRCHGGFMLDILLLLYLFVLLWVILDSYFVHSIQHFSSVFRISPNVSGSTLMAVGTSAPELLTGIINLSLGESNIVTGALISSSIFNVLAVPGLCGLAVYLLRGKRLHMKMNSWPIARDIIFYMITIIIFLLSIKDNSVDCLEAVTFICVYFIYICSLNVWSNFTVASGNILPLKSERSSENYFLGHQIRMRRTHSMNIVPDRSQGSQRMSLLPGDKPGYVVHNHTIRLLIWPTLIRVSLPFPNTRNKLFVLTYFLSLLWISGLTYLITWIITLMHNTFLGPDIVVSSILEGFCQNIPELISSFLVIMKFRLVDMAICNTLGSNIFQILICLGMPWFVKFLSLIVVNGSELSELGNYIIPLEDHILYFVIASLFLSLFAFIVIFCLTQWVLTIQTCIFLTLAYSMFIVSIFVFRVGKLTDDGESLL